MMFATPIGFTQWVSYTYTRFTLHVIKMMRMANCLSAICFCALSVLASGVDVYIVEAAFWGDCQHHALALHDHVFSKPGMLELVNITMCVRTAVTSKQILMVDHKVVFDPYVRLSCMCVQRSYRGPYAWVCCTWLTFCYCCWTVDFESSQLVITCTAFLLWTRTGRPAAVLCLSTVLGHDTHYTCNSMLLVTRGRAIKYSNMSWFSAQYNTFKITLREMLNLRYTKNLLTLVAFFPLGPNDCYTDRFQLCAQHTLSASKVCICLWHRKVDSKRACS